MSIVISRILGIIGGVLSIVGLGVFYFFPSYYLVIALLSLWWLATILIGRKLSIGIDNIILHIFISSAFFVLLSILEWLPAEILLIGLCGVVFTILWWWPTIGQRNPVQFMQKPWRRIIMVIWVFGVYAWITGLNAILLFYPNIPTIIISLAEGLIAAFVTFMILRLYSPGKKIKENVLGIGAMALMISELSMVVSFLPFGYLTSGLLIAWIWYVLQLLMRFHVSPEGVIWRKQIWFLVSNAVLLIMMLYFSQWI